MNRVTYTAKRGNQGRRYCDIGEGSNQQDNPSLTTISRNIRNTIYYYQGYKDFDFVASHVTLLSIIGKKLNVKTPCMDAWIKDKQPIIDKLSSHHSVENHKQLGEDHIKKLVCSALYGGGIQIWGQEVEAGNPSRNEPPMEVRNYGKELDKKEAWRQSHIWHKQLKGECKIISEKLWKSNPDFIELVCDKTKQEYEQKNQFMSYYLGVIENHCLYYAYTYFVDNCIIDARKCALSYDGFTGICPNAYTDFDYHIRECNRYILENTGFAVKLIEKKMKNSSIQMRIIEERRNLPEAEVAPQVLEVESAPLADEQDMSDVPEASDETDYHPQYLIWRERFEKQHCKIINSSLFIKETYKIDKFGKTVFDMYVFLTEGHLRTSYKHLSYTITNDNGKKLKKQYIDEWITDNNMRTYEKCDAIPPPLYCAPDVFNTWQQSPFYGLDITPNDPRWRQDAIDKYTEHIDVLCNHSSRTAVYVLKWLAQYIQNPSVKTTHLVFTSAQGVGKTLTFDTYKKMIGGGCYETASPEQHVWGNFNGHMFDNSLIILSEVCQKNQIDAGGRIKALITDARITINQKNTKAVDINSHHRFITCTNHPNPIRLEPTDRRNLVIKCSNEKLGDRQYFTDFVEIFEDYNSLLTLYSYLNDLDIDDWVFRLDPTDPITTYQQELMVEHHTSPVTDFFSWWGGEQVRKGTAIREGDTSAEARKCPVGCVRAYGSELMSDFQIYKVKFGCKYTPSDAGDLVGKIKLHCDLPEGAMSQAQKTNSGQRRTYNIYMLQEFYKIKLVPSHTIVDAMGEAEYCSDNIIHDENSYEVDIWNACLDVKPIDKRKSSSLVRMRSSGSLDSNSEVIDEPIPEAEVLYANPLSHLDNDFVSTVGLPMNSYDYCDNHSDVDDNMKEDDDLPVLTDCVIHDDDDDDNTKHMMREARTKLFCNHDDVEEEAEEELFCPEEQEEENYISMTAHENYWTDTHGIRHSLKTRSKN